MRRAGVALGLSFVASAAFAAASIDPALTQRMRKDGGAAERMPVLIHLTQQPNGDELAKVAAAASPAARAAALRTALKSFADRQQAPLLEALRTRKAEAVVPLFTVNAVAARLNRSDIQAVAARGDVAAIRYDVGLLAPTRRVAMDLCNPARPTPKQRIPKFCRRDKTAPALPAGAAFDPALPVGEVVQAVGAPLAWKAGHTGKGVTVAIVDSGVDVRHPDLAPGFRGRKGDWFDVHAEHAWPNDLHGHGTQIAGLITGRGASGRTLGVAPDAQWIAARIYNDRNVGRLSDLHRVMGWLLDPDGDAATHDAPQIALHAWGFGDRPGRCDTEFAADIRWLRLAGMHVVFAAGNGGPMDNTSVSPANNTGVLAVGGLDANGELAAFSSRGVSACDGRPYPDVNAPGEMLRTTDLSAGPLATTTMATGTSYAAAVIAGELALLIQARPKASPSDRETMLRGPADARRPPLARALELPVPSAPKEP